MITARLFARLREQAGTGCEQLDLVGGTVAEVYALLVRRHPGLEPDRALVRPTRNEEFVGWEDPVGDGDEVAFIPPVSGGTEAAHLIRLTAEPLDVHLTEVAVAHAGAGAICSFTGVVRDNNRGEAVTHLEYEAYGGMAERQMRRIADEIAERWPGTRVAMVHRTGRLEIGEASVVISVSAPRRADAFDGCRHAIERLKQSVPIWKKEFARSGAVWLEGPEARPAEV